MKDWIIELKGKQNGRDQRREQQREGQALVEGIKIGNSKGKGKH